MESGEPRSFPDTNLYKTRQLPVTKQYSNRQNRMEAPGVGSRLVNKGSSLEFQGMLMQEKHLLVHHQQPPI